MSTTLGSLDEAQRFLALIDAGEPHRVIELSMRALEEGGVPAVVDLVGRVQREVGERWHDGRYTVTQEHLATAVVDDVLGLLAPHALRRAEREEAVAMVCAEGEWHATPARMAALLLRDAGWRVQFLGASTPLDHLRLSLESMRPHALAVSCTLPLALPGAAALIDVARDLGVPVIVGGRAFDAAGHRAARLGADASFTSIGDAAAQLEAWLDEPPTPRQRDIEPEVDKQRLRLAERHDELVTRAYEGLVARIPAVGRFDDRRRTHTLEDLAYILQFADVALLVDDPALFREFVSWLTELLAARGVPEQVMPATLDAVAAALDDELDLVRTLVEDVRGPAST